LVAHHRQTQEEGVIVAFYAGWCTGYLSAVAVLVVLKARKWRDWFVR
jgi:uncharacterized protein YcsI (UPF0317 family)